MVEFTSRLHLRDCAFKQLLVVSLVYFMLDQLGHQFRVRDHRSLGAQMPKVILNAKMVLKLSDWIIV